VIRSERLLFTLVAPWQNSVSDIDLSPALSLALNGYDGNQFDAEQLLLDLKPGAYSTIQQVQGHVRLPT